MALQRLEDLIQQLDRFEVDKLLEWLSKGIGCLDTRKLSRTCQYRLLNATCISEQELKDRLFELPRKNIPFILIAESNKSKHILQQNGYHNFIECELNELLRYASNKLTKKKHIDYIPLFEPCSLLKSHIDEMEQHLDKHYNDKSITLECCDIGCGSGRDSIWLCLRKWKLWNVDCVDYNCKMLERVSQFALDANVSHKISVIKSKIRGDNKINLYKDIHDNVPFLVHDLNDLNDELQETKVNQQESQESKLYFFEKQYDLILCCRFLERCVVNKLWKNGKMLKQNGYLLMFTFMEGSEKFGKPKNPNYLLKKGELKQIFSDETMFKIIIDQQFTLDDGRPMQAFLCQKLQFTV